MVVLQINRVSIVVIPNGLQSVVSKIHIVSLAKAVIFINQVLIIVKLMCVEVRSLIAAVSVV